MTIAGGGLVFLGDDAKLFERWMRRMASRCGTSTRGHHMSASPMHYAIHGKQYVAIAAGSDIFSLALL
jgi:alcohol dehydrogenase (cytochrome c)